MTTTSRPDLPASSRRYTDLKPATPWSRAAVREGWLAVAVTFLVSWIAWGICVARQGYEEDPITFGLFVVGGFGPAVGALVVRWRRRGGPAVRYRRSGWWRVAACLPLGAVPAVVAGLIDGAARGVAWDPSQGAAAVAALGGIATFLLAYLVAGPLSEELGWRGTVHPRWRTGCGPYRVAGVLGSLWAVWHAPLFLLEGTVQHGSDGVAVLFSVLSSYPLTLLLGAAFEHVGAGVAGAVLVHFGHNVASTFVPSDSWIGHTVLLLVHAALAVLIVEGARRGVLGSRESAG